MTEVAPAVALLFDDTDLGAQLRDALRAHGARIVHEGGVASLSRQRLQEVAPDVVVVNLDDAAGDALDQLYDLLDGDRPRVVFNDAQASRALTGWDRDRWARHLAVKVLQAGDVDPPRPVDAREVQVPVDVEAATALAAVADVTDTVTTDAALEHLQRSHSESESLAAELEALLASAELPDADAGTSAVDADPSLTTDTWLDDNGAGSDTVTPATTAPAMGLDDFLLDVAPMLDLSVNDVAASSAAELHAASAVSAPTDWALLDDNAPASAVLPRDHDDLSTFGVEKVSAADYVAPDVEKVASSFEPVMNLELVSMEEAVAPRAIRVDTEMHLDELHMALSRLVLTGAAADGIPAAVAFFAALPASSRLTFLHTQHLGGRDAAALVGQLATVCPLTVRMATAGRLTQPGEVLVVPPAQRVRVHRDGRIELQAGADDQREPSINDSFTTAAEDFGRDALGIVFSGHGVDAVAGAHAIHDRGGSIWVESTSAEYADMVSGISAEGLVNFSGTPQELAAHLVEVFP